MTEYSTSAKARLLDRIAVGLSSLCLLHCLLLPVVIAGLPFLASAGEDHFHVQMLVVVIPVSTVALALGFRRHGTLGVIAMGAGGMLLLYFGGTVAHAQYGIVADRMLTIAGSLLLAVTHYLNSRLSRHRPLDAVSS